MESDPRPDDDEPLVLLSNVTGMPLSNVTAYCTVSPGSGSANPKSCLIALANALICERSGSLSWPAASRISRLAASFDTNRMR